MRYRKFCFPYCQFIATTVFQSVFKKKSCALCYQLTSECNFKNYKDKSISVHEDYEKLLRKKELMIRLAVIKNIEQKKATWKDKVDWDHLQNVWIENIQFLDKLNNGRSSFGNNVELLVGDNVLFQLLKSISNSKERVWIETYMFDNSPVAQSFINALIEAKQRGVDVVLIVDRLGSFDMSFKSLRSLRQNDIPVVLANDWRSPTFRDHRKLAIVDSEGFCGSANISAEAAPTCMGGNNRFFEIHVKVQGPAVNHMCELFCETLNEQGNSVNRQAPVTKNSPCTPDSHGSFVQILDSNAKSRRRCIQSAYQRIINNACLSVSTTAGYFSPPTLLYWSLKRLIQTSIPFTLILSGNSDVWGDVYAATYCVSKLQKAAHKHNMRRRSRGIVAPSDSFRVCFTLSQHCHAKTLVVDGLWTAIGSFNFDRHSGRRNMEAVVAIFDITFAEKLEKIYHDIEANDQQKNSKEKGPSCSAKTSKQCNFSSQRLVQVPTCTHMSLEQWYQYPFFQRFLMQLAHWFFLTSASPIFDRFEDVDEDARKNRRRHKLNAWLLAAETSFSFGPSRESLKLSKLIF